MKSNDFDRLAADKKYFPSLRQQVQNYKQRLHAVAGPSALQSVDLGSVPLSSHYQDFENRIHTSTAWRSAIREIWKMKNETEFA